jgi:hypothetical protein
LPSSPAHAWSNGVDGPNSYGTHDLILDDALQDVGEQAEWVDVRVALRATDDPDTVDGIEYASSPWWHVWDEWGDPYGGAPEAAQHWFEVMQRRREAGNDRGASKALGYLAHIVGDVANPLHTDQRDREQSMHSSYEHAVDTRTKRIFTEYDGEDPAHPYDTTLDLARQAHGYYFELMDAYLDHGYNRKVARITKRQLNRAVNALADLISSL